MRFGGGRGNMSLFFRRKNPAPIGQMELPIGREVSKDRNYDRGGRSFYFFDFDDNVAFLSTPIYLFHKETGKEICVSSGEFGQHQKWIGASGPFADFKVELCNRT